MDDIDENIVIHNLYKYFDYLTTDEILNISEVNKLFNKCINKNMLYILQLRNTEDEDHTDYNEICYYLLFNGYSCDRIYIPSCGYRIKELEGIIPEKKSGCVNLENIPENYISAPTHI